MLPLTFSLENTNTMKDETIALIREFLNQNGRKKYDTEIIKRSSYCAMIFTSPSICLSGLLLVEKTDDHMCRAAHQIRSFCVSDEFETPVLGSELLKFTHCHLQDDDFLQVCVPTGTDHDDLVCFFCQHGFIVSYHNATETCLKSKQFSYIKCISFVLLCLLLYTGILFVFFD